jgi:hypothetical protein
MGSRYYRGKSHTHPPPGKEQPLSQERDYDKSFSGHTDDTFEDSTSSAIDGSSVNSRGLQSRTDATVENDIQSYIDRGLKSLHDEIANEGVPERFQLLLDNLDGKKDKGS